jgi:hypothetical protein
MRRDRFLPPQGAENDHARPLVGDHVEGGMSQVGARALPAIRRGARGIIIAATEGRSFFVLSFSSLRKPDFHRHR